MSLPRYQARARRAGFTLIELTLAMGMAAFIGLAVYQAMYAAFRARTSAASQVTAMREAAVVLDMVEQEFASLVKPAATATLDLSATVPTTLHGPFVGYALGSGAAEADSVSFCNISRDESATDPANAYEGVQRVELVLRPDTSGRMSLIRRVQRNLLATTLPDPVDEILTRSARSFVVRYYDGNGWLSEWDSTLQEDRLPVAISVTIEFEPTAPRPGAAPDPVYTATRLIPIACGKPASTVDPTSATGGQQ